jgi:hypothetical protein
MSTGRGGGTGLIVGSAAEDRLDARLAAMGLKKQERFLSSSEREEGNGSGRVDNTGCDRLAPN